MVAHCFADKLIRPANKVSQAQGDIMEQNGIPPFLPVDVNVDQFSEDMMNIFQVIRPLWQKEDIIFKVRRFTSYVPLLK